MASATPQPLNRTQHKAFIEYYRKSQNLVKDHRQNLRARMLDIDKLYMRELDRKSEHLQAKRANKYGDSDRFQNVTIPIIEPQVETAVSYQTSVFLTGHPLFGVVANPMFMDEALQLETVLDEQAIRGSWVTQFILFFKDCYKYNIGHVEVDWCREVTTAIETDLTSPTKTKPKEVIWEGNRIRRLNPYNTCLDPRVDPIEAHIRGEFASYTEFMSRIELKQFIASLPDKILSEIRPAFESSCQDPTTSDISSSGFYVPQVNTEVDSEDPYHKEFSWMSWAQLTSTKANPIEYRDGYEVTTKYCRIIPSEFGFKIPKDDTPAIYKLIIINHQHIIYCERQTNIHNMLGIVSGQAKIDGLRYQTKSHAANAEPFQNVGSAYMNSIIHSRRRAISDRTLYDPSRISEAVINSPNPSAKMPVRPSAYGKNVAEAVYAFPYREDQAGVGMQQIQQLIALANNLNGQNQASQGQFVKGNKTLQEFESVMNNANGRDQVTAIQFEATFFMPLKHMLKTNILQYQGGTTIFNRDKQQQVEIDPIRLRKAVLEFKISDGLIPSSKLINADTFSTAIQVIGSSPQIGASYNMGPMFSYLMKTQGADLREFEKSAEQVAYEQALGSWQQLMQAAIENGVDPSKFVPQPKPQDYGYNPATSDPANKAKEIPNSPPSANLQ